MTFNFSHPDQAHSRLQERRFSSLARRLAQQRGLFWQLVQRDVSSRYRGSALGVLWSLLTPLLMLVLYSFVFGVIFQARWGVGADSQSGFALLLFAGLLVHGLLAEVLSRSPRLVLDQANYVKKVVFPLHLLVPVAVVSALFHALISWALLCVAQAVLGEWFFSAFFALPLVLVPLAVLACGIGWIFAALGVYLRDLSQMMGVVVTLLLFLSPVFYPMSAIPEAFHVWFALNPLVWFIEALRGLVLLGEWPALQGLGLAWLGSLLVACVGWWFFERARAGFADVL